MQNFIPSPSTIKVRKKSLTASAVSDFLYFSFSYTLFDPQKVAQHTDRVAQDIDLRLAMIYDLDRHFLDLIAKLTRKEDGFKIKGKAVYRTS